MNTNSPAPGGFPAGTPAATVTPEAVAAVMNACAPDLLDSHVCHLQQAEDALQKAAYENDELSYMFRFAYELRLMREEIENLQQTLGYTS